MDQLFFGICAILGLIWVIGIVASKVRAYMFKALVAEMEKEDGEHS